MAMRGFIYDFLYAEQDEGLEQLEETVLSTKHIALAVNEELGLHTRLIVCHSPFTSLSSFHYDVLAY